MTGDFFQLPPVKAAKMLFESQTWNTLIKDNVYVLDECFRQNNEGRFLELLRDLRYGRITRSKLEEILGDRLGMESPVDTIRIFALRKEAEEVNNARLAELPGLQMTYKARDVGKQPEVVNKMKDNWMAPTVLNLKVGAHVMLISNFSNMGLVNGSTGKVIGYNDQKQPVVLMRDMEGDMTEFAVPRMKWEVKQGKIVVATREQFPLILGWAITIHKSQGMTLDKVEICMNRIFEKSQLYVALSRCRSIEGIYLNGRFPDAYLLKPNAKVLKWWNEETMK
jgi:ATP-dependent DNA helicase PIF1